MVISIKLLLTTLLFAVAFIARADVANSPGLDLAPGQIWSIKSPSPTSAKVVIGVIRPWNDTIAVHVSVIDIPAPLGALSSGELISIDHMPFDKSALIASVDQLLATGAPRTAQFEHGYDAWRKDRSAGIFELSVSQAISVLLEKIKRRRA